jgi:hypothetical protein
MFRPAPITMKALGEQIIRCPYCGESIDVLIDHSVPHQRYIEDCQVCCRPIDFNVAVDIDGDVDIRVMADNE